MATRGKKPDPGVVERLSKRGEEAFNRLADELGRNERVSDALGRAASAKGRFDSASRRALGQMGLAAAEELKELQAQIERLEKRLAKLESASSGTTSAKRSETKKTATAKKRTTTRAKADQEKAPSPPPGRALGGGSGRGSSAG
jgi:polyhydroxyalkanoate synthesis regulator phasin